MSKLEVEQVDPYDHERPKSRQVEEMFDAIAPSYDLLNTLMTCGLHRYWRDKALRSLRETRPRAVLDVATGTGDVAFRLHALYPQAVITGIDLSEGMLAEARKKLAGMAAEASAHIRFEGADCLALPFEDASFDAITVAYGVRNFQQLELGYAEMHRVLKPGGTLCVIELSEPRNALMRFGYKVYTKAVVPLMGRLVSGDSRAYSYLPESIAVCPQREQMTSLMTSAGFERAKWHSLFPGTVTIYVAKRGS